MVRGMAVVAGLLAALLLAGHAAAQQIYPNVPFWNIKPKLHVGGVMTYRIWLNGRTYCFPDTHGYLVAPFCQKYVVGRANTLLEAEQLAAAAAGKKSGRRLTASDDGSESRNATRVSAAAQKNAASAANNNGVPNSNSGWSYSNTGGFYSYVPRPFMNTWVTYDFGQWNLWNVTRLNPDGSAWGLPLEFESVGRKNVCYDNFLSAATFSDAVFLAPPGSDRFVLENVDGFAWQMRLKSMKREIQGNPRKYLGASIWCQPYPNAGFQDACLGFYSKHDSQAITTWFLSPVNPCRFAGQTCTGNAQCCGQPNLSCVGSFGNKICARRPGPPGLVTVTNTWNRVFPDNLIITVVLKPPVDNGGAVINQYEVWGRSTDGKKIGPVFGVTNTFTFGTLTWGELCGRTWVFAAKAYNQAGGSPAAVFTGRPFKAADCGGGCRRLQEDCVTTTDCCAIDGTTCLSGLCTQAAEAPVVVSGPTGGVDGPYRTLTVQMSDPNTFGLPVLQYWFSATNKATLKTITGYNDVADGSTVTLSSAVAAFKAVMCTNADVTWINMEVWVVTEAGAGDKTAIATEAYTTACAP